MKRFLCLRFPNWPVQRLRADCPDLRDAVLILHRRDPRRGRLVVTRCGRAARAGVRVGTPLAEAAALVPVAVARPYDPVADLAALGRLAERCEEFSPKVGWETVARPALDWTAAPPDHLFLDITGVAPLFDGEVELARQAADSCRSWGYAGRLAVADTLGATWALATAGEPITIVSQGGQDAALPPLPVACLRLPNDAVELLVRLGIETVGQLASLSRVGLAERFGVPLLRRLDQAFGTAPEVLVPHRPPPEFVASERLEDPTDRRDVLDWILGRLIDRLVAELAAHGRGAVTVSGEVGCGPAESARFEVGLYRPTDLAKPLRELVRLHVERLALPGPFDSVSLRAGATVRLRPRQEALFADPDGGGQPLAALVERLSSRLGPDAVVRPVRQADALPELAVRFEPLVGRRSRPSSDGQLAARGHRPLRLFAPPVAVAVEGDGPPAAFVWCQQRHAVARWRGPERIETGWWRRGGVRRDYYRVETAEGRRFWLFCDLISGAWFLHGSFE